MLICVGDSRLRRAVDRAHMPRAISAWALTDFIGSAGTRDIRDICSFGLHGGRHEEAWPRRRASKARNRHRETHR
jgi:hypothetical protein